MTSYIPVPAPEDTVFIGYSFETRDFLFSILEAGGFTFIVQPQHNRILTSQDAMIRVQANVEWRAGL